MVATVPHILPKPAVRSRQGNRAFTLGARSAATETRTITCDATQGVRISGDPLDNAELKQGANLYWYVQNNAPNKVDSKGLIAPTRSILVQTPPSETCVGPCDCPPGADSGDVKGNMFTVEDWCDENPASKFPNRCKRRRNRRRILQCCLIGGDVILGGAAIYFSCGATTPEVVEGLEVLEGGALAY